jgi:pyruvate dehydrogenase E1 component beta subunit
MNGCRPIVEYDLILFSGIEANNAAKMRQMTGGQFNVPIVFVPNNFGRTIRCNAFHDIKKLVLNTPGLKLFHLLFMMLKVC